MIDLRVTLYCGNPYYNHIPEKLSGFVVVYFVVAL
jgi:hypothetical protein